MLLSEGGGPVQGLEAPPTSAVTAAARQRLAVVCGMEGGAGQEGRRRAGHGQVRHPKRGREGGC